MCKAFQMHSTKQECFMNEYEFPTGNTAEGCCLVLKRFIIPLIIPFTCQNNRKHSSKIPIFNDFVAISWLSLRKKIVLRANRTLKFQVLRINPLLADLQRLSVTLNDRTICRMIWKMWIRSRKPVANDSGH